MLVILYGAISKMGCRDYFEQNGFRVVEKLNYAVSPQLTAQAGARNYVSYEEFMENTDSLFRYEVGGIQVGFKQSQIEEAVYGDEKYLLTLSTKDIAFLERIKQVYGDKVCLIYTYIDTDALRRIAESKYDAAEVQIRLEIGKGVKEGYLSRSHIFDYVVVYGGDDSVMNEKALKQQLNTILARELGTTTDQVQSDDVVVAYGPKDEDVCWLLRTDLNRAGAVRNPNCYPRQGEGYFAAMKTALQHAKICIALFTEDVFENWQSEMTSLLEEANNRGCFVIPVLIDRVHSEQLAPFQHLLDENVWPYSGSRYAGGSFGSLSEAVAYLFKAEKAQNSYARQAEEYCALGMYDLAVECYDEMLRNYGIMQLTEGGHLRRQYFSIPEARWEVTEKKADLLMRLGRYAEARDDLRYTIFGYGGVRLLCATPEEIHKWLLCCAYAGKTLEETQAYWKEYVFEYYNVSEDVQADLTAQWTAQYLAIEAAKTTLTEEPVDTAEGQGQERIARHGAKVMDIFEELLSVDRTHLSPADLMLGYQRVLDYCKYLGLKGQVADDCIQRIEELRYGAAAERDSYTPDQLALKVYLGQNLPQSGQYDVFLSFKSEDVTIARTIYEFLTRNGKMVFFSKETLPRLGESEYKDAIFEAIDHSKHMIVVGSDPDYLKTPWVKREWDAFDNELLEERKDGNLLLVLSDSAATDKGKLPTQLRKYEIVKMSEFRERLLSYLR